jgi:hypothetical protein
MFKLEYEFEWNMLGIYNYNLFGKLSPYFDFLNNNLEKEGDLFEAGVYRGSTLLSTALFLKEKKSNKTVYGYDTFKGFPPIYHVNDSVENFDMLLKNKKISSNHHNQFKSSISIHNFLKDKELSVKNLSFSGDFSNNSKDILERKIEFLGLDNITLVDGPFEETMTKKFLGPEKIIGGIIDCDLYSSYKTTLEYIWPKLMNMGEIYLDEYYSLKFPGGRIACDEFSQNNNSKLLMKDVIGGFERWMIKKTNN